MKKLILLFVLLTASSLYAQWVPMSSGMGNNKKINVFASKGDNLFAGTEGSGIYRSTNYGYNWIQINTGLTGFNIRALQVFGINIYAGTGGSGSAGVFLTTNEGLDWNPINNGLPINEIHSLTSYGSRIYLGYTNYYAVGGIYYTSNNGGAWIPSGLGSRDIRALTSNDSCIFAGTFGEGIYRSTNSGSNWTFSGIQMGYIISLKANGSTILAGTVNGVYRSPNNGFNWIPTGLDDQSVYGLAFSGTTYFAGDWYMGVSISKDYGYNWIYRNQGLNSRHSVISLIVLNNYIYAGTDSNSVYRRLLSDIIGVQNISSEIPSSFSLSQNYPNPFNSSSRVKFKISKLSDVKIAVYDITGREVSLIVNERLQPGTYETMFDGSGLNSGVYFYRLTAGDYSETRKMVLIK